jgi:cysteine desulfurase family protein (TIGR01976 family)
LRLDLDFVRGQFPALAGDWTFFDNAGGAQTLGAVVRRLEDYLLRTNVQLGASYAVSRAAGDRVAEATAWMAQYVHAADVSEVVMGPSTTMLLRILSLCLAETWAPGDEVVVTNCDHEANIGPWMDLARRGIVVKTWRIDPASWDLRLDDLERLLGPRTRLVAVTHASNILGRINPIADIARRVHAHGALLCVDGVAYAPHRALDMQALGADFYVFSFYKTFGPHYALLYGKRAHLLRLPGINHFFIGADAVPYKFQPGNVNYELSSSMLGLWDYFLGLAVAHGRGDLAADRRACLAFCFDTMAAHEEVLAERFLGFLRTKRRVRIIGGADAARAQRVPTISFVVEGRQSDAIVSAVDPHRIGIRYGDFYARRLIDDLGLAAQNGVVRVSMVHYNTQEEVDRLIAILDPLL